MRRYLIVWTTLVLLVVLGTRPEQALSETKPSDPNAGAGRQAFAPGRIIVKVEEEAPANAVASLNRRNEARVQESLPHAAVKIIDLPNDLSVAEAVERYEASPDVEYAEPDYLLYPDATPNDPRYSEQWALNSTGQSDGTVDSDIDAPEAWGATIGSAETVVAVIDTGVDISHQDLRDNVWTNPDEIAGNNKDDDYNGYVDDINGWDFLNDDNTVYDSAADDAHGTHVAGTIAAKGNNGSGVTGVNWQAKILPIKFLGPNGGTSSDAIKALDYAVSNGVKISNNSWGGFSFSVAMLDALRRAEAAGHVFVASAGNKGANTDVNPHYPSGYDLPNVISVAATDSSDSLATFSSNNGSSNYGATSVDLAAPGDHILSTVPGNTYAYYEGTSMAAPHVTGVAALLRAQNPNRDHIDIKTVMLASVDKKENLAGKVTSGGRLNAARALGLDVTPNSAPVITDARPAASSKIRDRTPTISATVRDAETDLVSSDMRVYLDGRRVTGFSYSSATDRLVYTSGRLSFDRHVLKVVALDVQGVSKSKAWGFTVIR